MWNKWGKTLRVVTLFILLMYWSAIILAPVIAKERQLSEKQLIIIPKTKPNK